MTVADGRMNELPRAESSNAEIQRDAARARAAVRRFLGDDEAAEKVITEILDMLGISNE